KQAKLALETTSSRLLQTTLDCHAKSHEPGCDGTRFPLRSAPHLDGHDRVRRRNARAMAKAWPTGRASGVRVPGREGTRVCLEATALRERRRGVGERDETVARGPERRNDRRQRLELALLRNLHVGLVRREIAKAVAVVEHVDAVELEVDEGLSDDPARKLARR